MNHHRPIYLSIGTNMGDRTQNLQAALAGLQHLMQIKKISSIYETAPWGPIQAQPAFYNICVSGDTKLEPIQFLDKSKALEVTIGRLDGLRWGPRLIDIDLLFYENVELITERLIIPHKEVAGRAFVLAPLAEIAPNLLHPTRNKSIQTLMDELPTAEVESVIKLLTPILQAED